MKKKKVTNGLHLCVKTLAKGRIIIIKLYHYDKQ